MLETNYDDGMSSWFKQVEMVHNFSRDEWHAWLESHQAEIDYNGDNRIAAMLLSHFSRGLNYMFEKYQNVGLNTYVGIVPVSETPITPKTEAVFLKGKKVYIALYTDQLVKHSSVSPDEIFEFLDKDSDEVSFYGTTSQFYELIGVEVGHHAVLLLSGGHSQKKLNTALLQGKYLHDADDIEFAALGIKLQYAKDHKFPSKSIRSLQNRLDIASTYRNERGIK